MKWIFKPTIQNKMLVAILPLLFIQVVMVGGLTIFFAIQEFNTNVNQFNQQRQNDILTLSENPDILNYVQNIHYDLFDEATIYKNNLEELFDIIIKRTHNKKGYIYNKISFIDQNGSVVALKDTTNPTHEYKNVSKESYFINSKKAKQNEIDIETLNKDSRLIYTPLYLDVDGNGKREFSGILLFEYKFPLDEFEKATIISIILTSILIIIGIAIILATIKVVKKLTEPVNELVSTTQQISTGNLTARASISSQDEIGQLAESFNRMADDLDHNIKELEEYKNELEIKVVQRTQELNKSNIELSEAYKKLKSTQAQLVHSEKMASLGQLVAGVAHELNNPINFIYGNMPHLRTYINDIKDILGKYEKAHIDKSEKDQIEKLKEEINWDFIMPDLDIMINDCQNGAERSKKIVQDLKNFSRLGEAKFKPADIREGIETTLNLLANYYKNKIKVETDYDDIEKIECFPDQLNQVFMNLLLNAAQAMPQSKIDSGQAIVWISTKKDHDYVTITIKDNGEGIPDENIKKIFDPFFTTKTVGEGTGLGLSISYGIIEKHNGNIEATSELGSGTTFIIKLPINQKMANNSNSFN